MSPVCIHFFPKDPKTDNENAVTLRKDSHDNLSPSDNAVSHVATVTSLDLNNTHISAQLSHRHTHILSVHIYIQASTHTSHNPQKNHNILSSYMDLQAHKHTLYA